MTANYSIVNPKEKNAIFTKEKAGINWRWSEPKGYKCGSEMIIPHPRGPSVAVKRLGDLHTVCGTGLGKTGRK
jgi:hypothetical protein